MKRDKYSEFRDAMNKTEARQYVDGLMKKYRLIKRQNVKMLRRCANIVNNQNHYLKIALPARGGHKTYEKERIKFLRDFVSTKKKIDRLLGRVYVDEDRTTEPKYFLKLSRSQINKLLWLIKGVK
jgi:hypothetical protein